LLSAPQGNLQGAGGQHEGRLQSAEQGAVGAACRFSCRLDAGGPLPAPQHTCHRLAAGLLPVCYPRASRCTCRARLCSRCLPLSKTQAQVNNDLLRWRFSTQRIVARKPAMSASASNCWAERSQKGSVHSSAPRSRPSRPVQLARQLGGGRWLVCVGGRVVAGFVQVSGLLPGLCR